MVVGELHSVLEKRDRTFVVEEPTGAHERRTRRAGRNKSDFAKDIPAEFGTRLRHGVYTCNHSDQRATSTVLVVLRLVYGLEIDHLPLMQFRIRSSAQTASSCARLFKFKLLTS